MPPICLQTVLWSRRGDDLVDDYATLKANYLDCASRHHAPFSRTFASASWLAGYVSLQRQGLVQLGQDLHVSFRPMHADPLPIPD